MAATAMNAIGFYFRERPLAAVLSLVCLAIMAVRFRLGAALNALVLVVWQHTGHEFLLFSFCVIVVLFPNPRQMTLLLKVQITTLYVFTGISKLRPAFRSGEVLQRGDLLLFDHLPISLLVWGTIATELIVLPVMLWVRPKMAFWVASGFQLSILVGMWPYRASRAFAAETHFRAGLIVFAILLIGGLWACTHTESSGADRRSLAKPEPEVA